MSKYYLKADYDIQSLKFCKTEDTIVVDIPMLSHGKLNYGLEHVKTLLRSHNIFPSELGFDIITLATMVYLADTRIKRLIHGQDSWTREIRIQLPVSNVDLWNKQVKTVERMLKFLTGDLWGIEFVERNWPFELNKKAEEKTTLYSRASLFSGGMDSLISTINLMEQKENTLLFGHAGEGLTKNAQTNILNVLNAKYPEIEHTLIDLWMSFPDDYIPEGGNDANTRSRSFLFIGFALFSITGTKNIKELMIPENGLIALNIPLEITRVGSFSTRTTHPFYLSLWNNLLKNLGMELSVYNPYWNKTKGEMANECLNKSLAKEDIGILSVGTTPRTYLKEVELFSGVKNVHVALGLHPQLVGSGYDDWELFELLVQQCHYIGEVGLDFSKDYIATKMQQIKTFEKILLLCEQYGNKIVSIHSLKSAATVLEILNKLRHGKKNTYILHWFTGTPVQMEDAINLGCFFSINPKMLKTKSGINLIHKIPPNRILIETDAPFSGEFKNAKQLKNILQDMIDDISMIKGIDLKKYLIHNEETVFAY